jgi:hypothetical protein
MPEFLILNFELVLFVALGLPITGTVNMSSLQIGNSHSPAFETAKSPFISEIGATVSDSDCDQPGGNCRQEK